MLVLHLYLQARKLRLKEIALLRITELILALTATIKIPSNNILVLCLVIFNVVELPLSHFNCECYKWKIFAWNDRGRGWSGLLHCRRRNQHRKIHFWRPTSLDFPVTLPSQTQQP